MEINTEVLEKTGPAFSVDALMSARSKTKEAISMIAHSVKPGMLEEEARQIAKETLDRMGSQKGWHKILVRFGTNTIKNFEDPSEREIRLRDGDRCRVRRLVWRHRESNRGRWREPAR